MPINEKSLANLVRKPKGSPGTPGAGRKKGSIDVRTTIEKYLKARIRVKNPITNKVVQIRSLDAMILAQLAKAVKKQDTQAFNALLDRFGGRNYLSQLLNDLDDGLEENPNDRAVAINIQILPTDTLKLLYDARTRRTGSSLPDDEPGPGEDSGRTL